ncbi:MAG: hypothetical protein AW07_03665 [Candidatus Accumulibacter sp. SK-11]|nr:MAG: hypothetical protein AW07_03665 [Candidatus Accumulibacter sp. SK-11]
MGWVAVDLACPLIPIPRNLRIQVTDALLGLVTHPLAVVAHVGSEAFGPCQVLGNREWVLGVALFPIP